MENYNNTLEQYHLSQNHPKCIEEFMQGLDFLFLKYTREISKEKSNNLSILLKNIEKKGGITGLLKDLFCGEIDFDSDSSFTTQSLNVFLMKISNLIDQIISKYPDVRNASIVEIRLHGGNIFDHYSAFFFDDIDIKMIDIEIIEKFFKEYLFSKYLVENDEFIYKKDVEKIKNGFCNFLKQGIIDLANIGSGVYSMEKSDKLAQITLFLLSNINHVDVDSIHYFLTDFDDIDIHKSLNGDFETDISNYIDFTLDLYKRHFSQFYNIEHTKYEVKSVLLGKYQENNKDTSYLKMLPTTNFYFNRDDEVEPISSDIFPDYNLLVYTNFVSMLNDVSIFDIYGNKVYEGDISQEYIVNLKGTYYILSNKDGLKNIPKFALGNVVYFKKSKIADKQCVTQFGRSSYIDNNKNNPDQQETNKKQDFMYINPDYVAIKAIGKIQGGKYIENITSLDI